MSDNNILTPKDAVELGIFIGMVQRNAKIRYLMEDIEGSGILRSINPPMGESHKDTDVRDYLVRITSLSGGEFEYKVRDIFPLVGMGCLAEY